MWVVISRELRPDATYWPGRRWLALVDALAWPMLWAVAIVKAPFGTGLVGVTAMAFVAFVAARRSRTALFRNERYWFTARRWGLALAGFATVGAATKLLS